MEHGKGVIQRLMLSDGEWWNDGLGAIDMQRLSRIVALAGKNGAGKSRLLNRLMHLLINDGNRLNALRIAKAFDEEFISSRTPISLALIKARNTPALIWADESRLIKTPTVMPIKSLPPNFEELEIATRKSLQQHAAPVPDLGPSGTAILKICYACNAFIAATSEALPQGQPEYARKRFDDLKARIRRTLNTDLEVFGVDDFHLFGLPSDKLGMSDGQRRLLDITVKFWDYHWANPDPRDIFVLLDEPENYLHPDALIEMFDGILRLDDGIQIFVATHSLPLLAHIGVEATWFVHEGNVFHGGRRASDIVESLMGGQENIGNLRQYLAEPANFEIRRFTAQCLLPPETRVGKGGDPQAAQFWELLTRAKREQRHPFRVLDWGAGKGRMLNELDWLARGNDGPRKESVDYLAFDKNDIDAPICMGEISAVYGSSDGRYFSDVAAMGDLAGNIDIVLLCNVLHEIPPKNWPGLFREIFSTLAETGILVISEDLLLPEGEQAFDAGFALLPHSAICALFGSDVRKYSHSDAKYADRLVMYAVTKAQVRTANLETVIDSLNNLKADSLQTVKALKESDSRNWTTGHRYAIASQSIITATLALNEFENG